jgi:hypothetical protein
MTITPHSVVRPQTRRQHGLNILTDLEAWGYSDNEIIGTHTLSLMGLPVHLRKFFQAQHPRPGDPPHTTITPSILSDTLIHKACPIT